MNILVTGGAGFIGSHTVVELVNAGYNPIIIDDFSNSDKSVIQGIQKIIGKEVTFYEGNCNDEPFMQSVFQKEKIDGIIHFAAFKSVGESVQNPLKYYHNNINSLLVLLDCMQKNKVKKLVFSSSCTVYGQPENIPVSEETKRQAAASPYGNTKIICEDILTDTSVAKIDIQSISLRYFNPIGAHPSAEIGELPKGIPSNLVPFITQTAIGKREKITVFGDDYNTPDGTNIRDYIDVIDLAKAHVAAFKYLENLNGPVNEIFNVGSGRGYTVLEIIKTFENANNVKLNYQIGERRQGDIEKIYGKVDKAEKELNWKAEKTLEESLVNAWRWEKSINK